MDQIDISAGIATAAERLGQAEIDQPRREAASLLAFILAREASYLIAHPEYRLTASEAATFEAAVRRREAREPFQLIVGRQEFYGLDFEVEAGVLIPRPETELIVEQAIEILSPIDSPSFLEIGVGTGCISVAILHSVGSARAVAVDISDQALALTGRNALRHNVADRLKLINADLFAGLDGPFDLIVSNPPYIPDGDAAGLQPEVRDYEPPEALFAGEDGLQLIRKIVAGGPRFLAGKGFLLMEIGHGQSVSVKNLFRSDDWINVEILPDLQGIPRTVVAQAAG